MKRLVIAIAGIVIIALGVCIILPGLKRAKAYSGPGIAGNLRSIQLAKESSQADGNTNEWPSVDDIFPGEWSRGRSLNETLRHKHGELYFINRTGTPPFAYIPKTNGPYHGGELLILTTNGLMKLRQ